MSIIINNSDLRLITKSINIDSENVKELRIKSGGVVK
jgi:hypothetical protein